MALPEVGNLYYPTPAQIRDAILRSIKLANMRRGIAANVLPGSDHYIRSEGISYRYSTSVANNMIAFAMSSPLNSTGTYLVEQAGIFGVERRPATGAKGFIVVTLSGAAVIPSGFQCVAVDGHKYQTIAATTVTGPTDTVEVEAVEQGASTDQDPNAIVTWESAAIGNMQQVARVDSEGLTGGSDEDTYEELRQRLLEHLSFPGVGGNSANNREWSEDASAAVDDAFVYAAIRGPASYDIAISSRVDDHSLSSAVVNEVAAYVASLMPGHSSINVTTVDPELVDVVMHLDVPLPTHAGGAGGGWLDAQPWPASPGFGHIIGFPFGWMRVEIPGGIEPQIGAHVALWNPVDAVMNTYTVTAVQSVVPPPIDVVDIKIGAPLGPIDVGMFLSAACQNISDYATSFYTATRLLGPGEKTKNIDLIPRSLRHPPPDITSPYALTSVQLNAVMNGQPEILDLQYALRVESGTGPSGPSLTTPSIPLVTADPPKILVPRNIAFVRA
ncbi:MAG: baseplate J/gp47 family protein [Candidatus Omnitrophica bacterium]|nr:baseplate J/gp47 family protein [Candidatus Omnitrophota bacterium]